ncbi:MAG TPA: hypothetical protein VLB84_19650 [Bacteroidia bacterium]|nr:hypothetical protein [Bacteroidia bacterium]
MIISIKRSIIFFSAFFTISCNQERNYEKEKNEILLLDEQTRAFHFTGNAKAMANIFSANFISVNKGVISQPTYADSYRQFDHYFKHVEFINWDNSNPPIIRFSKDASIAYVVIDKLVVLKEVNSQKTDTTHFAWLSVYKKEADKWVLDCISSTNK